MSDLMLDVDQAGELKAAFRRGGWTNGEIKEATKGDFLVKVRKLLRGELIVKAVELLRRVAEVAVGVHRKFVAAKVFVVDTRDTARVKIGYIGDNFKKVMSGVVEKNVKATGLDAYDLVKNSLDSPILEQLGDKAETSLAHFYELLTKQPKGEAGELLVNGYWNIFFIKGADGKLWAVYARWLASYGDWVVRARPVDAGAWLAGGRVFARK